MNYKKIPNYLTWFRIWIVPIFIIVFYLPWAYSHYVAAIIFIVASITDWFDGYLARRWKIVSMEGAFLDPVADKILISVVLVLLAGVYGIWIAIPAAIIIAREIIISALREWMASMQLREKVAVKTIGKWKTTFQMVAIIALVFNRPGYVTYFSEVGYVMIYAATLLTLWSLFIYLAEARNVIKKKT